MKKRLATKKWFAPKLLVMVRNKPEESVLTACKRTDGAGPAKGQNQCNGKGGCTSIQGS